MAHIVAKNVLIIGLFVSLAGCAQIGSFSQSLWGHTKSGVNYVTKPVVNLLRSAPKQDYVFEGAPDSQIAAKSAFAADGMATQRQALIVPDLEYLPDPQAPTYQNRDYVQAYQVARQTNYTPTQMAEAAPLITPPQESNDISFVKIGGGSNMNDWLVCEAEAGGFIRVTQSGYLVDPGFESCMRAKGYKPESEVADVIGSDPDVSL